MREAKQHLEAVPRDEVGQYLALAVGRYGHRSKRQCVVHRVRLTALFCGKRLRTLFICPLCYGEGKQSVWRMKE